MSVTLSPQTEDLIRQKIASGAYPDADAVVQAGLHLLGQHHDRLNELRAKIRVGLDQIERGETIPYTDEFWDDLDRGVDEAIRRGEQPDPDVCP
jgi:putative addiction module CopG family antidote